MSGRAAAVVDLSSRRLPSSFITHPELTMHILEPAEAAIACGGTKLDPVIDHPINDRPVPIWHPVFFTDV